jgi:flagellar transcriptional activator FlhD
MTSEQMLTEIREANLTYLMLSQSLIRQDKAQALFRLGISEESADLIATLSPSQIMKLAPSNMLLCRFRADDDMVWNLLTQHNLPARTANESTARLHANLLMSSRFAEASI